MVRAWHVQSVNEWNMTQERVVALSTQAYFRVKFDRKTGKILKHVRIPMAEIGFVEEHASSKTGVLLYSRVPDGARYLHHSALNSMIALYKSVCC